MKGDDNRGCDFWAVDLDNAKVPAGNGGVYDAQNQQFAVIVVNPASETATVSVTIAAGAKTATYTVEAKQQKVLALPDPAWGVTPLNQDGTSINSNAYHIQSDRPVVAFQFNPLQSYDVFSNDASLLLPSHNLGYEYHVMTRAQSHAALRAYFAIVATEPGATKVLVQVPAKTLGSGGSQPVAAGPWKAPKEFTLQQGQVMNVETDELGADLTGAWIQADKRIAVFAGSEASNSPATNRCIKPKGAPQGTCLAQGWTCVSDADCPVTCCADHLEEQLLPVTALGTTYPVTKTQPRGKEADAWRIVAVKDGTLVAFEPAVAAIQVLDKGEWLEFESDKDFVIEATKAILVGQFIAGANAPDPNNDTCDAKFSGTKVCKTYFETLKMAIACKQNTDCPNIEQKTDAKIGDPAFLLAVPSTRYLDDYTFVVPDTYKHDFINVAAPIGASVSLDGKPIAADAFSKFGDGQWRVARLAVSDGVHRLTGTQKVGLTVYGWDSYVSYGYPGGLRLK